MDGQPVEREKDSELDRLTDRLELLGDLDDFSAGGAGGFASGVEIFTDSLFRGPDDLFDTLDRVRDLDEGTDVAGSIDLF